MHGIRVNKELALPGDKHFPHTGYYFMVSKIMKLGDDSEVTWSVAEALDQR